MNVVEDFRTRYSQLHFFGFSLSNPSVKHYCLLLLLLLLLPCCLLFRWIIYIRNLKINFWTVIITCECVISIWNYWTHWFYSCGLWMCEFELCQEKKVIPRIPVINFCNCWETYECYSCMPVSVFKIWDSGDCLLFLLGIAPGPHPKAEPRALRAYSWEGSYYGQRKHS